MIGAYAASGISGSGCHKNDLGLGLWCNNGSKLPSSPDVNLAQPVFGLMGDALKR